MTKIYARFLDGKPEYLVRHYWWAYLWSKSVWFFDHQPIINAILFGQYQKLMSATLQRLKQAPLQSVLQLTCVYGSLTPNISQYVQPSCLHITDVAEIQLALAQRKTPANRLLITRMNAEALGYKTAAFSTIVLFFLLHEMPRQARRHTLAECMRTLQVGGSLIMTEYATLPKNHLLYRFPLFRWIMTSLEPFLATFWHEDIEGLLNKLGQPYAKQVQVVAHTSIFFSFYRVTEFKVTKI